MNFLKVVSPRIHNLGDFVNCLPTLSGLSKAADCKISLAIHDKMSRFKGIKELLLLQDMFCDVHFLSEPGLYAEKYMILEDYGDYNFQVMPYVSYKMADFICKNFGVKFEVDRSFTLNVPKMDIDYMDDKFLIGDRWSAKISPDIDTRRYSNHLEESKVVPVEHAFYLDYNKSLVYNCSLIKYNKNPFITTFTGIGILADLMYKNSYILWGDDLKNWNDQPIEYSFKQHHFDDRNCKLMYINDFKFESVYGNNLL